MACLMVSGLSACVDTGLSDCGAFKPLVLPVADVDGLSDDGIRQILTHNELGLKLGCWGYYKRDL